MTGYFKGKAGKIWRRNFAAILPLKDDLQRDFYAKMCRVERWSVRALRKKIDGMLYERTAISKKPEELIEKDLVALREEDRLTPDLVFRGPYFLDFLASLACRFLIYQQLHNYPVGSSGKERKATAKGNKYNITPARRSFMSNIKAYIAMRGNDELENWVMEGLAGKRPRNYGMANTRSALFAPVVEPCREIPEKAWVRVGY